MLVDLTIPIPACGTLTTPNHQVVATVAQMTWARGTEKALRAENAVAEMKE